MTTRRDFLKATGCGLAMGAAVAAAPVLAQAPAKKRPNILFIMTDDHAAHAITAYGSRINKTPNLDRLAAEGALFQDVFVTNSICAPSRACILTGMYSCQNGVPTFNDLSPKIKTVGGTLREAGYYTAMLGKWHMGGVHTMRDSDWDRWAIYQWQGVYFDPFFLTNAAKCPRGFEGNLDANKGRISFPGEYATDNLTRVTKSVIDEAVEQDKPFCVFMLHKAPHRNWLPSPKYKAAFRAKTLADIPCPDTIFDDFKGRASPIKRTAMTLEHHMRIEEDLKLTEYFSEGGQFPGVDPVQYKSGESRGRWPKELRDEQGLAADERERRRRERIKLSYLRYMQDYLACVQSVDDSVGEMLDYLKAKGLDENTIVIYTADQGFFLGDHGLYDKRFMMEETLKMPFLVRWPAAVKPGTVNTDLITNVDFAAFFADAAGAPQPSNWQGRSFLPNITTGTPKDWRKSFYYRYYIEGGEHNTPAHYGVRTPRYKLIRYYKVDEWELFDLKKDPEELENVYGKREYAKVTETLKNELFRLKNSLGDADQYYDCGEYDTRHRIDNSLFE